jgi:hypothetical protein
VPWDLLIRNILIVAEEHIDGHTESALGWPARNIMEFLNLTEQQWRGLRESLPPLQGKDGRRIPYERQDVLALLVITEITSRLRMTRQSMGFAANAIWQVCFGLKSLSPENPQVLALEISATGEPSAVIMPEIVSKPNSNLIIVVPLAPLMRCLVKMEEKIDHHNAIQPTQWELFS